MVKKANSKNNTEKNLADEVVEDMVIDLQEEDSTLAAKAVEAEIASLLAEHATVDVLADKVIAKISPLIPFTIFGTSFEKIGTRLQVMKFLGDLHKQDHEEEVFKQIDWTNLFPYVANESKKTRSFISAVPSGKPANCSWPFNDILAGITVLLGGTGAGKSEYLWNNVDADKILRFGEPAESWDNKIGARFITSTPHLLAEMIGWSALGKFIGVDSLRYLAYNSEGAAGKYGIVASMFTSLTDLNNVISHLGVNIPTVFNPMVSDEDLVHVYSNAAASTAGALMIYESEATHGLLRTVEGRRGIDDVNYTGSKEIVKERESTKFSTPNTKSDSLIINNPEERAPGDDALDDDKDLEAVRGSNFSFT